MDACTDLLECSICMHPFEDARILRCGHTFCLRCLRRLEEDSIRKSIRCPTCRCVTNLHNKGVSGQVENFFVYQVKDAVNETKKFFDTMQNDFSIKEHQFETASRKATEEFIKMEKEYKTASRKAAEEFIKMEKEYVTAARKSTDIFSKKTKQYETALRKEKENFSKKKQELKKTQRTAEEDFYKKEQHYKTALRKLQDHFSWKEHDLEAMETVKELLTTENQRLKLTVNEKHHVIECNEKSFFDAIEREQELGRAAIRKTHEHFSKQVQELEKAAEKAKIDIVNFRIYYQEDIDQKSEQLNLIYDERKEFEVECHRLKTSLNLQNRKNLDIKYELQMKTSACEVLQSKVKHLTTAHYSSSLKQELSQVHERDFERNCVVEFSCF